MLDLSIIIINKNYLTFLKKCINSCLNQVTKYKYEVILIDDGSTDGSILFAKKIKNKKLTIFQTKNEGIEKAANKGFKKSNAKYVVRVDSDDYLHKNFVNIMLKEIIKSNNAFVYSNYYLVKSNEKKLNQTMLPIFNKKEIFQRGDFLATGTIYNKNIINKIGYYNENIKNSGLENYELIIKLICNKYYGKRVNRFLFYYRRHVANLSLLKKKKILNYGKKIFKKMHLGNYKKNKFHPWN
jgi:glycosyltransferase involved in cell wall biosynthesis